MFKTHIKPLVEAMVIAAVLLPVNALHAATLLELEGNVSLSDGSSAAGTGVTFKVDLDRDGDFAKFERASAVVEADGSYAVKLALDVDDVSFDMISFVTELLSDFDAGGFEALVDDGPLTVAAIFEKEGYSKVIRTMTTNAMDLDLSVQLSSLEKIFCSDDACGTSDGSVVIEGFMGDSGIVSGYTTAYDPTLSPNRFPGTFTDADDNLLVSSGFIEVNLRDDQGETISDLDAPATVRFALNPASWSALVDRDGGSGEIEVPMYSFDEGKAEWVAEADGVLVNKEGSPVDESKLDAIRGGSYAGALFVEFTTDHFSYFNVDEPVESHACIKGRLVTAEGEVLVGMDVTANGISYTGSTPGMTTGPDGRFAAGVMKSETGGEDINWNDEDGETFSARLTVAGSVGVSTEFTFETPTISEKIVDKGGITCTPAACPCDDLGDVTITLIPPRLCEVTIIATFDGSAATDDYDKGEPFASRDVTGEMVGVEAPVPRDVFDLCDGQSCNNGTTDSEGRATIQVPLFGHPETIRVSARWQTKRDDGDWDVYQGSVEVDACSADESAVDGEAEITITHSVEQDLGDFILDLFEAGIVAGDDGDLADKVTSCFCTVGHANPERQGFALMLIAIALSAWIVSRRRKK